MFHAWFSIPVKILLSPTPKTSPSGFGIWPSVLVSTLLDANMTDFGSSLLIPAWTFSLPDMIPEWLCSSLNANVQLLRCMETSFITSRIGTYENWTLRQARTRLSCSCGVEPKSGLQHVLQSGRKCRDPLYSDFQFGKFRLWSLSNPQRFRFTKPGCTWR